MNVRRIARVAFALVVCSLAPLVAVAPAAAQALKGYQPLQAFQDRFSLQYPAKDWLLVPGGGASLVVLTQKKNEATVTIEYQPLQIQLEPGEIDAEFAKIEAEPIEQHQPTAEGVKSDVTESDGRKIIVINFTRRGATGAERVRQYSLPIGQQMYRIVCSAPAAQFAKYEPVFANIVKTFAVSGAAPAAAPKS